MARAEKIPVALLVPDGKIVYVKLPLPPIALHRTDPVADIQDVGDVATESQVGKAEDVIVMIVLTEQAFASVAMTV